MKSAAVDMYAHIVSRCRFSCCLGTNLSSTISGSNGWSIFNHCNTARPDLFPFLPGMPDFLFLHLLSNTSHYVSFLCNHPCQVFFCGVDLYFAWWLLIVSSFSCASWSFIDHQLWNYLFKALPIQKLDFVTFLLLGCKSSLYSVDISYLPYIRIANISPVCWSVLSLSW
jgi:hypothetical protein